MSLWMDRSEAVHSTRSRHSARSAGGGAQSPGRQKTPGHSNDVQLEGPSFIQPVFKYLLYARHGASGYSTEVHEDRFFFLGITTSTVS